MRFYSTRRIWVSINVSIKKKKKIEIRNWKIKLSSNNAEEKDSLPEKKDRIQ